jgi:hypothetical protein
MPKFALAHILWLPCFNKRAKSQQHVVLDAISARIRVGVERCELRAGLHAARFLHFESLAIKMPIRLKSFEGQPAQSHGGQKYGTQARG